jgi:NADH-quinone oxidoreductase subunit F
LNLARNQNFTLYVVEGAGAFVCGEEIVLIASIEEKSIMILPIVTLATTDYAADAFREMRTAFPPGVKIFCINMLCFKYATH